MGQCPTVRLSVCPQSFCFGNGRFILPRQVVVSRNLEQVMPDEKLPYRWASGIEPKSVEWTWQPRLPRGHVTDLSGDPGVGKGYLTLALAAALSRGIVPG